MVVFFRWAKCILSGWWKNISTLIFKSPFYWWKSARLTQTELDHHYLIWTKKVLKGPGPSLADLSALWRRHGVLWDGMEWATNQLDFLPGFTVHHLALFIAPFWRPQSILRASSARQLKEYLMSQSLSWEPATLVSSSLCQLIDNSLPSFSHPWNTFALLAKFKMWRGEKKIYYTYARCKLFHIWTVVLQAALDVPILHKMPCRKLPTVLSTLTTPPTPTPAPANWSLHVMLVSFTEVDKGSRSQTELNLLVLSLPKETSWELGTRQLACQCPGESGTTCKDDKIKDCRGFLLVPAHMLISHSDLSTPWHPPPLEFREKNLKFFQQIPFFSVCWLEWVSVL